MSKRTLETLIRRIREELRAEGPDGVGYTDFIVQDAINSAIIDLSEVFPVQDTTTITTIEDTNTYELDYDTVYNIVRVEYDGDPIEAIPVKEYLALDDKTTGDVEKWTLWGTSFVLIGDVDVGKTVTLWITRAPDKLTDSSDTPEIPSYADEAIIAYAMSICYRESRNFDKADYYYRIYVIQKSNILRRGVPQRQKDHLPKMRASYWAAFKSARGVPTSDTNPGGNS